MPTTVTVQFLSHLATLMGRRQVEVTIDGTPTVSAMTRQLQEMHGETFTSAFLKEDGGFSESVVLLVNGLNLKQLERGNGEPVLRETDDITFIVPFGGG